VRPFPFFVELADHARPNVLAPVVELFLELVFDELAFLLDDEDLFEPFGETAHPFGFERPDHADLVDAQADLRGERLVDAQIVERLAHVQISLA